MSFFLMSSDIKRQDSGMRRLRKRKPKPKIKIKAIDRFIYSLSVSGNIITEFDDTLWLMTVDKVIAESDGTLIFVFKD